MRISITDEETIILCAGIKTGVEHHLLELKKIFGDDGVELLGSIYNNIYKERAKPISVAKKNATKKANEKRTKYAKEKIVSAINILRLESKKITIYSVSKKAGVSYNTAKKYKNFIESK